MAILATRIPMSRWESSASMCVTAAPLIWSKGRVKPLNGLTPFSPADRVSRQRCLANRSDPGRDTPVVAIREGDPETGLCFVPVGGGIFAERFTQYGAPFQDKSRSKVGLGPFFPNFRFVI
jgi:hypothetical protein